MRANVGDWLGNNRTTLYVFGPDAHIEHHEKVG